MSPQFRNFLVGVAASGSAAFAWNHAGAASLRCDVALHSAMGGTVEVVTGYSAPNLPQGSQVYWHVGPASSSIGLIIVYLGANLDYLGNPSGGHIDVRLRKYQLSHNNMLIIMDENGQSWSFHIDDDLVLSSRRFALYQIGFFKKRHEALISAVGQGHRITISVSQDGRTIERRVFNLSKTEGRDALLSIAKSKVTSGDTKACSTEPTETTH